VAVPKYQETMLPALKAIARSGSLSRQAAISAIAVEFKLSDEDKSELISRGTPRYASNIGWALTYLKQAGLVESVRRGEYGLTDRGREVLRKKPKTINNQFLSQFAEFSEFRGRRSSRENQSELDTENSKAQSLELTPNEALEAAYLTLRAAVESELISAVKIGSASFFEQIVIDVLVAMGYGGNRAGAANAIGKSGDGGIDGIIDEDRLGLDVIYVQAKRWDGTVGRPEIQKFNGALAGHRARKGVFVTTSSFTKDALEYVQRIDARIVLIDGDLLASLMYEHGVGVSVRKNYEVKSLDGDYFDSSE
jgi:restriction system protein